jgi:hypothetical protein
MQQLTAEQQALVDLALADLAGRSAEDYKFRSMVRMDWPSADLGLGSGGMSASVITPGYMLVFANESGSWAVYHTDYSTRVEFAGFRSFGARNPNRPGDGALWDAPGFEPPDAGQLS